TPDLSRARQAEWQRLQRFWHPREVARDEVSMAGLRRRLKRLMWEAAGPFRTEPTLSQALGELDELERSVTEASLAREECFGLSLLEKLDLRHMLLVSRAILSSARLRRETRGAHVRLDYPQTAARAEVVRCALDAASGLRMGALAAGGRR